MSNTSYQPGYLKSKNRKLVFDLFAQENSLSRADIVRLTGMSFPTASKTVDYLLAQNILTETEVKATASNGLGRRSHFLAFNPAAYNALGIEFEGHFAELGLVDLSGEILQSKTLRFSEFTNDEEIANLASHAKEMLAAATSPVLGVGIGFPSNINPYTSEIVSFDTLNINQPVSFHSLFAPFFEAVQAPVCVENDVNLACLGELFLRRQEESNENLAYLTLGTGFGAGLILNGKLWQGASYKAGEIGNTVLGRLKPGDRAEPMECAINIQAINEAFGLTLEDSPALTSNQCHAIIEFILPDLITSIHNFVYLLDIEQFVFSGFIPRLLGEPFYTRLNAELNRLLNSRERRACVVPPRSHHAVLVGAASMMFDSLISDQLSG